MPSPRRFAIAPIDGHISDIFLDQAEAETEAMILSVILNGARINVLTESVHSKKWRVIQQIFA